MSEVWISGLNWHIFLRFYLNVYSLVFVSIEKIFQTLEALVHRLSKHLECRQKYSAARLGILVLPHGWDSSPSQALADPELLQLFLDGGPKMFSIFAHKGWGALPWIRDWLFMTSPVFPNSTHLYSWVERGTIQQHNTKTPANSQRSNRSGLLDPAQSKALTITQPRLPPKSRTNRT